VTNCEVNKLFIFDSLKSVNNNNNNNGEISVHRANLNYGQGVLNKKLTLGATLHTLFLDYEFG